jgi:hypothetical protein
MLGVGRTSVSVVAGTLQKAGFITYRRGNIRLLEVAQLEQGAWECYETVKGHYARWEALWRKRRPALAIASTTKLAGDMTSSMARGGS